MSYERNFYNQYRQLSDPSSQYYQKAYGNIRSQIAAGQPTTSSLLGVQMAMGGSYKGSLAVANRQRRASETRGNEAAQQGLNRLYTQSQGQATQALQGAQGAYQYEDSQPGVLDYLAGPAATIAGNLIAPGIGGAVGGMLGGQLGQPQQSQFQYPTQQQYQLSNAWGR